MKNEYIIVDIETTGLDFWNHRVIGIGLKNDLDERFLTHPDEKTLLELFWNFVKQYPEHKLIGFNIGNFDLQFLTLRSLKHGLPVQSLINRAIDIRRILTQDNKYQRGRLEDYADLLGQRPHLNGFRKRDLPKLWEDPEDENLLNYALSDVRLTHLLFLRMQQCALI